MLLACARDDAAGRRLRELLEDDGRPLGRAAVVEARQLLFESGALAEATRMAIAAGEAACRALDDLPPSHARDELAQLARSGRLPGSFCDESSAAEPPS